MARFQLPLTVDFTCRTSTPSTALAKGTYIQNGFFKQDSEQHPPYGKLPSKFKLYNRPAFKEAAGVPLTLQILDIVEHQNGTLVLVAFDSSNNHTGFYTMANSTAAPVLKYTFYTTIVATTYNSCTITPVNSTVFPTQTAYFVTFNFRGALATCSYLVEATGSVTAVTGFPDSDNVYQGGAYLDTYMFVLAYNATGDVWIYNSAVGNVASWAPATDYIIPDRREGLALGIELYRNHIAFFGTRNIQFFYDAAQPSPGSPLLPRHDLVYNCGVLNGNTKFKTWWKSHTGEILAFIGITHDEKRFIGVFNDFAVEPVSNPYIDELLKYSDNITICGYSYSGKTFLHVCINQQLHLYYDMETRLWHVFNSTITHFAAEPRLITSTSCGADGKTLVLSYVYGDNDTTNANAGRLYYFDAGDNSHQDYDLATASNVTLSMVLQTPRYRGEPGGESQRKFHDELQIIGDTLTSADTLSIQYSDDDYQTFSAARTIDLTASLKQLTRLGYFRERAFKLTYSGTQQVRFESLEGQLRMGTN